MRCALALLAALVGVAVAAPAGAVSFGMDLDELEGHYPTVSLLDEKTQVVSFSDTQPFRLVSLTLELEGAGVCSESPCDPPPSFRFEIGVGTFFSLGPYPDVFADTVPITLFRPAFFRPGETLELGLTLGRWPTSGLLVPVPSAPTNLTRVAVTFTGDFLVVPEPTCAALALAALTAVAFGGRRPAVAFGGRRR